MDPVKPLFIFSLPRSGSTLLQKILMTHSEISSTAEPWILLPLLSIHREYGLLADYNHKGARKAIQDFIGCLGGKEQYHRLLREFVLKMYDSCNPGNCRYFLDKTPRYYLIIDEIMDLFPGGKFIFLFRNPLAVFSSVIRVFNRNRLKTHYNHVDLSRGPGLLSRAYREYRDRSLLVRYEDLVMDTDKVLRMIGEYLGVDEKGYNLHRLGHSRIRGKMGDRGSLSGEDRIQPDGMNRWREFCNSGYRKYILKKYVKKLDGDYFSCSGLTESQLIGELDTIRVQKPGITDAVVHILSLLHKRWLTFAQVRNTRILKREIRANDCVFY